MLCAKNLSTATPSCNVFVFTPWLQIGGLVNTTLFGTDDLSILYAESCCITPLIPINRFSFGSVDKPVPSS